jgi:hypothetical protein
MSRWGNQKRIDSKAAIQILNQLWESYDGMLLFPFIGMIRTRTTASCIHFRHLATITYNFPSTWITIFLSIMRIIILLFTFTYRVISSFLYHSFKKKITCTFLNYYCIVNDSTSPQTANWVNYVSPKLPTNISVPRMKKKKKRSFHTIIQNVIYKNWKTKT